MPRSISNYILITLKGIAIDAADVFLEVSRGTIAFTSGIYEELHNTSLFYLKLVKQLQYPENHQLFWAIVIAVLSFPTIFFLENLAAKKSIQTYG